METPTMAFCCRDRKRRCMLTCCSTFHENILPQHPSTPSSITNESTRHVTHKCETDTQNTIDQKTAYKSTTSSVSDRSTRRSTTTNTPNNGCVRTMLFLNTLLLGIVPHGAHAYTTFSVALGYSLKGANVNHTSAHDNANNMAPVPSATYQPSTSPSSWPPPPPPPPWPPADIPTALPTHGPIVFIPFPKGPLPKWMGLDVLTFMKEGIDFLTDGKNITFGNQVITPEELSSCVDPVKDSITNLINSSTGSSRSFSFSMFNSWGVFPDSAGNYYECTSSGNMYCSIAVNHSDSSYNVDICVPETCSETQLQLIQNVILEIGTLREIEEYNFGDTTCITNDTSEAEIYVRILLFAFIFGIPLLATIVDAWKSSPTAGIGSKDENFDGVERIISPVVMAGRMSLSINNDTSDDNEATPLLHKKMYEDNFHDDDDDEACETFGFVEVFSIIRSWRRLTADATYGRALRSLDGIRVISMLWIIAGQTMLVQMPFFRDNSRFVMSSLPSQPLFQIIQNASLATDSFLLVSGFLAMYKILKQFSRRWVPRGVGAQIFSVVAYVFKRVGRLLPLLAITMLFYCCMLPCIVNGPNWVDWLEKDDYVDCANNWWRNLLFVNNLYSDDKCMSWTWYIGVDVQLHTAAPGIALLFWHRGVSAVGLTFLFLLGSIAANIITISENKVQACPADFMDWQDGGGMRADLLEKPWNRGVPFFLGFMLAFWYNIVGDESGARNLPRVRTWRRCVLAVLAGVLLALPLFGTVSMRYSSGDLIGECKWSLSQNFAYLALFRLCFSLGLFLMVLSLLAGWSGWLLNLLCMPAWTPLSRLVYAVYLVHPIVLEVLVYGANQEPQYTPFGFAAMYITAVVLSFVVSAGVFLLLQGPLIGFGDLCIRGFTRSARSE